jgi:hypothetical protein
MNNPLNEHRAHRSAADIRDFDAADIDAWAQRKPAAFERLVDAVNSDLVDRLLAEDDDDLLDRFMRAEELHLDRLKEADAGDQMTGEPWDGLN